MNSTNTSTETYTQTLETPIALTEYGWSTHSYNAVLRAIVEFESNVPRAGLHGYLSSNPRGLVELYQHFGEYGGEDVGARVVLDFFCHRQTEYVSDIMSNTRERVVVEFDSSTQLVCEVRANDVRDGDLWLVGFRVAAPMKDYVEYIE